MAKPFSDIDATSGNVKKTLSVLFGVMILGGGAQALASSWSYQGDTGPEHWGELTHDFFRCKQGVQQSPINIVTQNVERARGALIKPAYHTSMGQAVNNGHSIQVNLADAGGVAGPDGRYKLLQFHFHTPSEETLNGRSFPMDVHLVHQNEAGQLKVLTLLVKEGRPNAALQTIFSRLPNNPEQSYLIAGFDVARLLPASLAHFAFQGSLTTPPCSEDVAWRVLQTPIEMSAQQIQAFRQQFGMNARPVQNLNDRKVLLIK